MRKNSDEAIVVPGATKNELLGRQFSRRFVLQGGRDDVRRGGPGRVAGRLRRQQQVELGAGSSGASSAAASSGSSSSVKLPASIVVASSLGATNFDPEQPAGSLTLFPLLYDSLFDTSTPPELADVTKLLANYNPAPGFGDRVDPGVRRLVDDHAEHQGEERGRQFVHLGRRDVDLPASSGHEVVRRHLPQPHRHHRHLASDRTQRRHDHHEAVRSTAERRTSCSSSATSSSRSSTRPRPRST